MVRSNQTADPTTGISRRKNPKTGRPSSVTRSQTEGACPDNQKMGAEPTTGFFDRHAFRATVNLLVSLGDAASLFSGGLLARPSNSNVNHCTYTRVAGTLTSSLSWTFVTTVAPCASEGGGPCRGRGIMWDAAQLDISRCPLAWIGLLNPAAPTRTGRQPSCLFEIFDTNWKPAEDDRATFSRLIQDDIDADFAQEFHCDIARKKGSAKTLQLAASASQGVGLTTDEFL